MKPKDIEKKVILTIAAVIGVLVLLSLVRSPIGIIFLIVAIVFISKFFKENKDKFNQVTNLFNNLKSNYTKEHSSGAKNQGGETADQDREKENIKEAVIADDYSSKVHMVTKKFVPAIIILIILVLILINSIVVIKAGKTGVVHLFGKVRDTELRSGIHLVNPLAKVTQMSVRTEQYTMSIATSEGQKKGDDSIEALTNEGLKIKLDLTVFYHLKEEAASDVFRELGESYEEKIIRPEIRSAIRESVANYDSKAIYTEKRIEVTDSIHKKLQANIDPRGIAVEQVLLRNVILPSKLEASIQEKLQAEQENQRYDFVLAKEEKEAERKRIEARGQRDAQKTINESLTDKFLNYLYVKDLKDRPGTIYVPVSPESGLPLFKDVSE